MNFGMLKFKNWSDQIPGVIKCQVVIYLDIEVTQDYSKSWARNEHCGLGKIGFSN